MTSGFTAAFPQGFTVIVRRPAKRNEFGDRQAASEHTIDNCAWGPRMRDSREYDDSQRMAVITGLQLYGPPMPDIEPDDHIILPHVMGLPAEEKKRTYRVIGEVGEWRSPFTGWHPGFECSMERVA